jgi:predicted ferric reductase
MDNNPSSTQQEVVPSWVVWIFMVFAGMAGAFLVIFSIPLWAPGIIASIASSEPKMFWYLSRASAIFSYAALWLSTAMGMVLSTRMAAQLRKVSMISNFHQVLSVVGLVTAAAHGLLLIGDHYLAPTILQVLVPFTLQAYRPQWVGLGQIAFYLWGIILFSTIVRRWIGGKLWRGIHYLGFLAFAMGLVHGITSGTDSGTDWAFYYYWVTGGVILFLLTFRILSAILHLNRKPVREMTS